MNRRDFNKAMLAIPVVATVGINLSEPRSETRYEHITLSKGFTVKSGILPSVEQLDKLRDSFMDQLKELSAGKTGDIFWRVKPKLSKASEFESDKDIYKIIARLSIGQGGLI